MYKGNVSVAVILTKLSLESLEHPSSVILSLRWRSALHPSSQQRNATAYCFLFTLFTILYSSKEIWLFNLCPFSLAERILFLLRRRSQVYKCLILPYSIHPPSWEQGLCEELASKVNERDDQMFYLIKMKKAESLLKV